ncbi:MAG TPA: TonB-dependent receptor [Fluviicoccus sp.]|nr:TonB-dependent receptor [Fluviicoccus sp.]
MFKPSILAAAVAACSSLPVIAETTLPTQVITATRTVASVDETLAGVQVINRQTLEQHQGQDLGDILRFTTGLDIARLGGFGGQTSTFMRGTESNHTLILIDGVRINSATSSQGNIQNLVLSDIERIEVVKGPMSTLYGSDAIGGVINIITRTPEKTETRASLSSGEHQLVNGGVSQSWKSGSLTALADISSLYTDGYPIVEQSTLPRGYRNTGGHLKLGYDLNGTRLGLSVRENRGTAEYLNFGTPATQDFLNRIIAVSLDRDFGDAVRTQLRFSQMNDDIDQNESTAIADTRQRQLDWQNTLVLGDGNTLIAGLTRTDTDAQYDNGFGTLYDKEQSSTAIYLQDQIKFQNLTAQLAGRHERYDSFGNHSTGNIGLGYRFAEGQQVYFNAGTAFKAPDLNELYGFGGNVNLKPESSESLELGSKHQLGQWQVQTAFFQTRIEDLLSCVGAFPCLNINVDKAKIQGTELSIDWQDDGFRAGARAGYTHARDENTGDDLLRRPRRSLAVNGGYAVKAWGINAEVLAKSHAWDAPVFGSTVYRRLSGYATTNLQGYLQLQPNVRLALNLENIAKKTYGYAYSGASARYTGTPRTASLSAHVTF